MTFKGTCKNCGSRYLKVLFWGITGTVVECEDCGAGSFRDELVEEVKQALAEATQEQAHADTTA